VRFHFQRSIRAQSIATVLPVPGQVRRRRGFLAQLASGSLLVLARRHAVGTRDLGYRMRPRASGASRGAGFAVQSATE
jgi:hypothetical protein